MAIFRLFSPRPADHSAQASATLIAPALVRTGFVADSIGAGSAAAPASPACGAPVCGGSAPAASGAGGAATAGASNPGNVPNAGVTSGAVAGVTGSGGASATAATAAPAAIGSASGDTDTAAAPCVGKTGAPAADAKHAVVLGAGIAGLSAAWELQRKGWRVTVLEQGERIGGAVQTLRRDGWQVECGPNTMMVASREFEEMIAAIGLKEKIVKPSTSFKKRFLVRGGQLHNGPATFGEFAKTPLFSTGAKLQLFWNLVWGGGLRRDLEDESLGSFFRRQFGKEVVDVAIRPVITGVYAGDADRLSLRHAFPFVWEAAQRSRSVLRGVVLNLLDKRKSGTGFKNYMIDFEGGLHALPEALAASLHTRPVTGATVTAISQEASGGKWRIAYTAKATASAHSTPSADAAKATSNTQSADAAQAAHNTQPAAENHSTENHSAETDSAAPHSVELHADALVLAAPSFAVAGLPLPPVLAERLGLLAEIEYPPLANVALGYRREQVAHALDGFGAVVADKEEAQVLGVLFSSSVYPQVAPKGRVLLTSFIGGTRAPELAALPPEQLIAHTHAQISKLLGIKGEPEFANTAYWPRAIPQRTVGYSRYLNALDAVEADFPTLSLVGNYRGDIALAKCAGDSVLRARELAQRLV